MSFEQSYSFDDLALYPCYKSNVISRSQVDTSTTFLGTRIGLPVVVAPMNMVVSDSMAVAIHGLCGMTFLPRTDDAIKDLAFCDNLLNYIHPDCLVPSIPANNGICRAKDFANIGVKALCIDVANGFSKVVQRTIDEIKHNKDTSLLKLVAGNVGSLEGYKFLANLGVDAVRVNIGSGSMCTTSLQTAVGIGGASLIRQIASWRNNNTAGLPAIISDGGIRSPREVGLSLALGADVCMMGRYFASCKESPGATVKFQGQLYKQYAGQASFAVKRSHKYVEGEDTLVKYTGTAEEAWWRLSDGLVSAMSYMNCNNIEEFKFLEDCCFRLLSAGAKYERTVTA